MLQDSTSTGGSKHNDSHATAKGKAPETSSEVPISRPKPNLKFLGRDAEPQLRGPLQDGSYVEASPDLDDIGKQGDEERWYPLAQVDAHFPLKAWWTVMLDLIRFPERNSSYILRADILDESYERTSPLREESIAKEEILPTPEDDKTQAYRLEKSVRRRLLPRNPNIDKSLDQLCCLYKRKRRKYSKTTPAFDENLSELEQQRSTLAIEDGLVVYTPIVSAEDPESDIPWYHPKVKALAFRYLSEDSETGIEDSFPSRQGTLRIDVQLFRKTLNDTGITADATAAGSTVLPVDHRLMRTAKSLLETQHKHAFGVFTSYTKRVHHDVVVPREEFQDEYIRLKTRYANDLISGWQEKTDPSKHVFEDLGIAAFLVILWKMTYPDSQGRPPGGFVDVGCGNGLLVHILRKEGYAGFGFDLRARKSWDHYETSAEDADEGEKDLRVIALDAPSLVVDGVASADSPAHALLPRDSFLIGNHADELTPWIPLLAMATPGHKTGFINIPCCPWQLNGEGFRQMKFEIVDSDVEGLLQRGNMNGTTDSVLAQTINTLRIGPAVAGNASSQSSKKGNLNPLKNLHTQQFSSRNVAYLNYVGMLQLQAGWHVEKEALRIPSTKNWCLIGRRRVWEDPFPSFSYSPSAAAASPQCSGDEQGSQEGGQAPSQIQDAHESLRQQVLARVKRMAEEAAPGWKARTPEGNAGKAMTPATSSTSSKGNHH